MTMHEFDLANESETRSFGARLASQINKKPALIFLRGDLGAGKTTFAQGFIGSLIEFSEPIVSPTYAYMNIYSREIPIYHFDLYRIDDPSTLFNLGIDTYIADEQAIRLIEWPERMGLTLPSPQIEVQLVTKGKSRQASVRYF